MPATENTLFVPFKGGLDSYSNPQLLPPGYLTDARGVMLDRPGCAYPGPGYRVYQWSPAPTTDQTIVNHGIGSLSGGPGTDQDQLVFWSTLTSAGPIEVGGPCISAPGLADGTQAPKRFPLAPWRQKTENFTAIAQGFTGTTAEEMGTPPQCAVCAGLVFHVWLTTAQHAMMAYQAIDTGVWVGPFILQDNFSWTTSVSTPTFTINQISIAGDGTYFRVAFRSGTTIRLLSYLAANPTSVANSTAPTGTFLNIDGIGSGDETVNGVGVFVVHDSANTKISGFYFDSTASTFSAQTDIITTNVSGSAGWPLAVNLVRNHDAAINTESDEFLVATRSTASVNNLSVARTSALATPLVTTITSAITAGYTTTSQLTVSNVHLDDNESAVIWYEATPTMGTQYLRDYTWNQVHYSATVTLDGGTHAGNYTTIYLYGGTSLLGKLYGWSNGVEFRPVVALRSGWWATDGTWGAAPASPAYPNGYLYDYQGHLLAKFGNADVGSPTIWPPYVSASYAAGTLQPLTTGFNFNLTSGQPTLTYPFPLVGYIAYTTAGFAIGTKGGLATVTWIAPTAAEPSAPTVQFGGLLTIAGAITAYYDGSSVFEAGFFIRTPAPFVLSDTTGGSLPAATYTYQAVAVYYDATGHVHYAAPSLPVSVTTTGTTSSIKISMPIIRQTIHNVPLYGLSPITFLLYRNAPSSTTDAAQEYELPNRLYNYIDSGAAFTAETIDVTIDANLILRQRLPTSLMEANASAGTVSPPPFDCLTVWNDQIWGLANRNGPELWCTWPQSTAVLSPEGPAWSPANRLALPAEIGQPKILAGLDEKLFILGTKTDYGVVGRAPVRSSSIADDNSLFSAPLLLPTPGGAKVLNGVTRLPAGLLFQGDQGFVLLTRQLIYQSIGTGVQNYTNVNLYLPGLFVPAQQMVLLYCADDPQSNLAYFYGTQEWTVVDQPPKDPLYTANADTVTGATRSTSGQSSSVFVLPSSGNYFMFVQQYSRYMQYRTPWIQVAPHGPFKGTSVSGYGMLREVQLVGLLPGGLPNLHQTISLETEYDYAGNTMPVPDAQVLQLAKNDQAAAEYVWRFGFSQGNASRVRFTVTVFSGVNQVYTGASPAVILTGLMVLFDTDQGLARLGASSSTSTGFGGSAW